MTEVQVLYGLIILVPVLIFASMLCYGIYRFACMEQHGCNQR